MHLTCIISSLRFWFCKTLLSSYIVIHIIMLRGWLVGLIEWTPSNWKERKVGIPKGSLPQVQVTVRARIKPILPGSKIRLWTRVSQKVKNL